MLFRSQMNSYPAISPYSSYPQVSAYLSLCATGSQKVRVFRVELKGLDGAAVLGGS